MDAARATLLVMLSAGCVNEYHPEYHPVTVTTVNQIAAAAVSAPASVSASASAAAPASVSAAVSVSANAHDSRDYASLFAHDAGDPFAVDHWVPYDQRATDSPGRVVIGPGVYLGSGVHFHGAVTINGNVYIDARRP